MKSYSTYDITSMAAIYAKLPAAKFDEWSEESWYHSNMQTIPIRVDAI